MKSASWETSTGALSAMLSSNSFFLKADVFTWTFRDGTVLRTTNADQSLTFNGHTYATSAPEISRTKTTLNVGTDVDSVDLMVIPTSASTISGYTWQAAARLGYLDGAQVLIETAYLQTWPTVVGTYHVFQGQVSDVYPERTAVKVTVKSALELLAQNFPHNVFQSVCLHTVYDTGCGLAKASYTYTSTVGSSPAPTTTSFHCSLAQAVDFYTQGVVTFTSGANNGLRRTIKSYDGAGNFTFALPLPVAPSVGDGISAFAGCDKTIGTCRAKFSNDTHFRGFPWIPTPENATPAQLGGTTQSGKG